MDNRLAFAQAAVESALRNGATQAEASLSISERFSTEARDQVVTKLEQSTGKSLHLRVFVDGRKATLATSDFDDTELQGAIAQLIAGARHVAPDRFNVLPESRAALPGDDLQLYSSETAARDAQAKLDEVRELERRIREIDSRIENSNGSHVGDSTTSVALANSRGFAGEYRATRASRGSSPVAIDGNNKRTGSYGTAARKLSEMESVELVAQAAVKRTVELFGARKPQTMQVPVIFERDVAASVLSDLFAALNAANIAIGNSWLTDRLDEQIGSPLATITDDGRMVGALGSSPFDGEGVPTQRTTVFDAGKLRSFLFDTYYALKLGSVSTGNSTGGGIGPNTFYLQAGTQTVADIIASTKRGVYVVDTIGFATEHASGTYSRGARGFYIENGELAYPIDEFTIAGTFPSMLAGIDAVANDLRFDASVVSPTFRIAEMTISGS
ncbi:MAG: TldD/PmbA family protein [Candidatus Eremiobacteraeota bacterium]|nr:TldD/PmbA family protein [Candidatus Eremiobacteraeota bacterium]